MTRKFATMAFAGVMGAASFAQAEDAETKADYYISALSVCRTNDFDAGTKLAEYCQAALPLSENGQKVLEECLNTYLTTAREIPNSLPIQEIWDREAKAYKQYGQCRYDTSVDISAKLQKLFDEKLGRGVRLEIARP